MLKFCWCSFVSVVLSVTVFSVFAAARPQLTVPLQALNKVGRVLNDSAVTFIKKLSTSNTSRDDENNKTRTRILFRGDLIGDFGEQDIIFPDAYQVIVENIPRISTAPKCAKGKTFCEEFDPYPFNQVRDILHRKRIRNDFFGKDEPPDDRYSITNRNGDFESFICTSIQKTVFPRVGKNKNNKWKFIINQEENDGFVQGIRIEVCRKEGSACDLIGERANGYITSCKQKYMLRRMMSLSETGDPIPDTFQLPSACCCSYRKDLSFLSRFGIEDISARSKVKTKL